MAKKSKGKTGASSPQGKGGTGQKPAAKKGIKGFKPELSGTEPDTIDFGGSNTWFDLVGKDLLNPGPPSSGNILVFVEDVIGTVIPIADKLITIDAKDNTRVRITIPKLGREYLTLRRAGALRITIKAGKLGNKQELSTAPKANLTP